MPVLNLEGGKLNEWNAGDRVWYEPSPGCRFAGLVLGSGVSPETRTVRLVGGYWLFKGRPVRTGTKNAISVHGLSPRTTGYAIDEVEQ